MPTLPLYRRLAATAALCLIPALAQAQTVRVVVREISVFIEPHARAAIVTTLPRGVFLEVAEELEDNWYMVRMPGGKKLGFVNGKDVERVAIQPYPAGTAAAKRPSRARSGEGARLTASLDWIYTPSRMEFSESRSFTKYRDDSGRLKVEYAHPTGPGFAADLQWMVRSGVAIQVGLSAVHRTGSADLTAQVPHPLYFQRSRDVTSTLGELAWQERALHVDVAYARRLGPLRAAMFAGVGFFTVDADVVEKLIFTQSYPYNTAEVTSMTSQGVSASAAGPDLGLSLEVPLHRNVGLGALLRYSSARVKLQRPQVTGTDGEDRDVTGPQVLRPASDTAITVDAGGLRLGLGVRVYF